MTARAFLVHSTDWLKQTTTFVKFKLFQNQHFQIHLAKNLEMCKDWFYMVTSLVWTFVTVYKFALLLQKNHSSFLSQSELSNFFAYIITIIIWNNNIIILWWCMMQLHWCCNSWLQFIYTVLMSWLKQKQQEWTTCKCSSIHLSYSNSPRIRTWIFQFSLNRFLHKWYLKQI